MTTSRLDERTKAEAAAAEWWQYQPFPLAREGVPYVCGACGATIGAREGTSLVGTTLMCPSCTERTFETAPMPTQPGVGPPIGPPAEQLPYRPVVPDAIRAAAPLAAPDYPAPTEQPPPAPPPAPPPTPPLMQTAPPVPPAGATPAAGAPHSRGRKFLWVWVGLGITTVVALVAALLVWSPWSAGAPPRPTGVTVSSTAGTATITWAAAEGGTPVTQYLLLRDGEQIATVTGSSTSYVDEGLVPGSSYSYTVVAQGGDKQSPPSTAVVTTTPTPSPTNLRVTGRTITTLTLRWDAPANSPTPDRYVIVRTDGLRTIGSVSGSRTTYRVTGLALGTRYAYRVIAYWGDSPSDASAQAAASTIKPAVKAARLAGSLPLRIKVTATGGGTLSKGKTWTDTWRFAPVCKNGACTTVLHGDITPPGTSTHSFNVRLVRHGAVYTGSTRAHVTHCGPSPFTTDVHSTLNVTIRVLSGHIVNGRWMADRWQGTLRMDSPYTSAGMYYCPAQTVVMTLTGR